MLLFPRAVVLGSSRCCWTTIIRLFTDALALRFCCCWFVGLWHGCLVVLSSTWWLAMADSVLPGLYISNFSIARKKSALEALGVTHILNCTNELPLFHDGVRRRRRGCGGCCKRLDRRMLIGGSDGMLVGCTELPLCQREACR